jgi:hypothetical protein
MVIDAYRSYKIDRPIAEGQFNGRWLFVHFESRTRREHVGGGITPDRLREVAACETQQLPPAAADIQPSLCARHHPRALQQPVDQQQFPTMEMERIMRESIPDRIV